jgi:N4-gp56 family major capsid protein
MLTNAVAQVWSARILAKLEKTLIFGQPLIINSDYEGDISQYGDRVHVHSVADPSVSTYVPGTTQLVYEDPTDSRVTLIIDQVKSFSFRLEDVNVAQMRPDSLVDELSIRAAYKLRDTADTYIAGLYTGATNTVATSQITAANAYAKIVNVARQMDDADIPEEGRFLVVKPWIKELLLQNADFLRATEAAGSPAVLNGQIGTVAGIAILSSRNVVDTGSAPVVSHCVAGHNSAWSFAQQILNTESLRIQDRHGTGYRGLHAYGAKVMDGARLWDVRLNP